VWWYVTKTLCALCLLISFYTLYVFGLGLICFAYFVGTITFLGGRTSATFREACEVHELVDIDAPLDKCLEEAAKW
jgi:hypothetical protein